MNYSTFTAFVNILSQTKKEEVSPEGNSQLLPQKYSKQELSATYKSRLTFQALLVFTW